jgi:hypothetical protein
MDADSSLGTRPTYGAGGSLDDDQDPASGFGRPVPAVRRDGPVRKSTRSRASRPAPPEVSNFAASFPLFFFGGGCVAAAVFVLLEGSRAAIGRIPLWVPFVALGIIALAGGTLSLFAEPDETVATEPADDRPPRAAPTPPRATLPKRSPRPPVPIPGPMPSPSAPVAARPDRGQLASRGAPRDAPSLGEVRDTGPVAPAGAARDETVPDDVPSLLRELDSIEAVLRSSRVESRPVPPAPGTTVRAAKAAKTVAVNPTTPPVVGEGIAPPTSATPEWLEEPEAPRQIAHCVGCGSAMVHAGAAARCHACGEPLCADCRDRSLAEGKPNLCPLCGLLDSVHAKGPMPGSRTSTRT